MKCKECGTSFETADKVRERLDSENGYWTYEVCPNCKSDQIEETQKCLVCGEENEHSICDDCMAELSTDENVLNYSTDRSESVELGALYVYHFTTSEIEEILLRELKNSGKWEELKDDFLKEDYADFREWMEGENV